MRLSVSIIIVVYFSCSLIFSAPISSDEVIPILFDTSLLQRKGQFTETSLPLFLAQAYQEKKLTNSDFSRVDCLTAKRLGPQGGYNIIQLFLVTSTFNSASPSHYIIKESKRGIQEITNLKEIEKIPQIKDLSAPHIKPGLPTIALPCAYFSYTDTKTIHYIMVMPCAQGKPLSDFIITFRNDQTAHNKKIVARAFYILGKETANFHKLLIVHGDFHLYNLFFDLLADHCTFIDNETMVKSFNKPESPAVDICKLFFMPFNINRPYKQFRDLIAGIDLATWCDIAIKNFALGYASTFSQAQQKKVYREFKKICNEPFVILCVHFDNSALEEIRQKYINPIFDKLIAA